ncbi:cofactor-independent phosphoglycerate mutase [Desulfogranum japonicum]|uniref:cofactor-independent phosphoglycerate mutase n=1 Tax=Desulfogranum japonicum TaxID=231447 RepID=UPI00040851BB|nr:cofactor-independent phosphoglycerate mutase [Desulfogranum japonicum]
MKYVLLIGDGMGDVPVPQLNDQTPLEAARTPTMDRLSVEAEKLLLHTVPEGYPPGSDVANLSLLGYAPERYYTGRAPLEAASMGVELASDEVAFRCNLVNIQQQADECLLMKDYSAGHITTKESTQLINSIQEQCGNSVIRLHPGISYRHLLVYSGTPAAGVDTVPPHDYSEQEVTAHYHRYKNDSHLFALMEKARIVLADHPVNRQRVIDGKLPANAIWLWGEGKRPAMETIPQLYGVHGGMISAVDLLMGLGVLSGLEVVKVEGATGYLDTNYAGKAEAAIGVLKNRDLVVVHVEAPDETGHQGLAAEKVQAIEDFDEKIVRPIVESLEDQGEEFRVVVTMDHYTPIHRRTHEGWPVPLFLYDSRKNPNPDGILYSEKNVLGAMANGGKEFVSGTDFFRYFLERG